MLNCVNSSDMENYEHNHKAAQKNAEARSKGPSGAPRKNLNRLGKPQASKAASAMISQRAVSEGCELGLVQEPWQLYEIRREVLDLTLYINKINSSEGRLLMKHLHVCSQCLSVEKHR